MYRSESSEGRELTPESSQGFAVIAYVENILQRRLPRSLEWDLIHALRIEEGTV
jgi:hypothetical protein